MLALGDSITSGEGNPDIDKHGSRPAIWRDRQCDRSAASWAALVAKKLENATTSVTFLDFACSGASAWQVGLGNYNGEDPQTGDRRLPGQVLAAERTLGPLAEPWTRPVDIILMSGGINDVRATDLLERCADLLSVHNDIFHDCLNSDDAKAVVEGLRELPATFGFVGDMLPFHLKVSDASVHVVAYPEVHLFTKDGGCNAFADITRHDAKWFIAHAKQLNDIVRAGANRNGWTNLHGYVEKFRVHDYCNSFYRDSWFRAYSASNKLQGNKDGTAHPTRKGHEVIADTVLPQIHPGPPPPTPARLAIQLQQVCVTKQSGVLPDAFYFDLSGWRPIIQLDSKHLRNGGCVTVRNATGTLHVTTAGDRIEVTGALVRERSSCSSSCQKPKLPKKRNKILPGEERGTEPTNQTPKYLPSITFHQSFTHDNNWGVPVTEGCTPGNLEGCVHPTIPIGVQYGPVHHVHMGPLQVAYRIGIDYDQPTLRPYAALVHDAGG
ncbi:MAG: GDSL-type esterase/lipase family protein [Solirubrobacteraceae bacterium]